MATYQGPRGTQDVFGIEMTKWHAIEDLIRKFTHLYHVEEIRTPVFEHTEVFKRESDSSDMVNKEMYTFTDFGGRSLTLRPEGTAGLIRSYVEHKMYANPDAPQKFYYIGPNMRYERPQKGRLRIHHQFGVEFIGAKSPLVDAEVIHLGYAFVSAIGLKDLKVLVNTLGDDESRAAYREALKSHFLPHLDTLCPDCNRRYQQNPLRILDCKVDAQHESLLTAPKINDYLNEESKAYFNDVVGYLEGLGMTVEVSDRLVRGLDYYTHTVFEIVSANEKMGSQSTIFGGGRYDGLVEYFGGPSISGIGFGLGIERLLVACDAEGIDLAQPKSLDVYIMPLSKEVLTTSMQLSAFCRGYGFSTELDVLQRSMKAQFKSAERMDASVLIFVGEDEVAKQVVKMKNVKTQEQLEVPYGDIIHQLDHWLDENHVCDHDHEHEHGEEEHEHVEGESHL
jgi:histidyl-tRNA synthetase